MTCGDSEASLLVVQTSVIPSSPMKKTVLDQIPEHIRALVGYVPGKPMRQAERESGVAMIKLASNENPFGPSPLALVAIREAAAEVAGNSGRCRANPAGAGDELHQQ